LAGLNFVLLNPVKIKYMKRLSIITGFAILAMCCLFLSFKSEGGKRNGTRFMEWKWSDCEHQAQARNKPIFVFIGASYCNLSARMGNVFRQKDVGELLNENFVCNKMSSEGVWNNVRASNWGVTSVPSFLFFTAKGKLIYKAEGFKDRETMVEEIQTAMQKLNEVK
jgi:thioredoxin-related protein